MTNTDIQFKSIIDKQVSLYPLVDQGMMTMDDVNHLIEVELANRGLDPEKYTIWLENN